MGINRRGFTLLNFLTGALFNRVKTRLGELEFSIPQVRDGKFYPKSLEKGLRSERALKLALAEMYVHGVSTRKVAAITEELCGLEAEGLPLARSVVHR